MEKEQKNGGLDPKRYVNTIEICSVCAEIHKRGGSCLFCIYCTIYIDIMCLEVCWVLGRLIGVLYRRKLNAEGVEQVWAL